MVNKVKGRTLISLDERSIRLARADGTKCTEWLIAKIHENFNGSGVEAVLSGSYKLSVHEAIEQGTVVLAECLAEGIFEDSKKLKDIEPVLDQLGELVECEGSKFFGEYEPEHHYVKNQLIKFIEWPEWDSRDKSTVIDRAVSVSRDLLLNKHRQYRAQLRPSDKVDYAEDFIRERNRKGKRPTGEDIAKAIRSKFGGDASANSVSKDITPSLIERGLKTGPHSGHDFPEELSISEE